MVSGGVGGLEVVGGGGGDMHAGPGEGDTHGDNLETTIFIFSGKAFTYFK